MQRSERIVIEVWPEIAPLACENFLALITGKKGVSGAPLSIRICWRVGTLTSWPVC